MLKKNVVADPKLMQNVSQGLSGFRAPSRIAVRVSGGEVTLSGSIQYEHQRNSAMNVARNVSGVRRVIDRLQILPAQRKV